MGHVEHYQVAAARVLHDLACRGLGLFMVMLAMDDGSEAIPGVTLDPLPDVQHRPAGGINQHAADSAETLEVSYGHAEGRHDDHVVRRDRGKVELAPFTVIQQRNTHVAELLVDVGVVDDLAHEKEAAV